jgi:N-acetylmuramoyl-L-alanine amidase
MVSPGLGKIRKTYTYGLVLLIIGLLLCLGTARALAFDVCVNGVQVELPIRPSLKQGKVMLPLECLAYPLGLEIECEGEEAPIALVMDDERVVFFTDSSQAMINGGQSLELGAVPYRKYDEIMVPMNLLVDALGITVSFDKSGQTLLIEGGNQLSLEPVATASNLEEDTVEPVSTGGEESEEAMTADVLPVEEHEQQIEMEIESTQPSSEPGSGLAISQFLQEMRAQTSALAGDTTFRQSQGTRLVGVLPGSEKGRQRLDFITDAKVEVQPMLLADPARLVLDVEGAIVEAIDDELYVGQGVIHRVRLSQYQEGIARAVVDLAEATGYQVVEPLDGNGFSVLFNQRLGRVSLWRSGSTVRLRMETSGPVQYTVWRLKAPNRMVVDIKNTTFVAGTAEVKINDTAVRTLRISQYTPTTTRVVMELEHPLDVVDIDAGAGNEETELAFSDPEWGREGTVESGSRTELAKTTRQSGAQITPVGLRQLAALGHRLVNMFPNSKALAMAETSLTDITTIPPGRREGFNLSGDEVDKLGDGDGSDKVGAISSEGSLRDPLRAEPSLGQIRFDGFDEDFQEGIDTERTREPRVDSSSLYSDEIAVPLGSPYREVDFSSWPRLQANWIGGDARAALQGRSILIDAGHGGFQPGAPGITGVWEKTYNLELALRVGELLQWAGAQVSYTRMEDQTISLRERVDKVQTVNAEILVSIHANASLARDATGTETLYHPAIQESQWLAKAIQEHLVDQLGLTDRGTKQRHDLYILRHSPVPSALVEVGFLDHPEEGVFLLTSEAIDKASMGLVRGIAAFFKDNPVMPRPIEGATPLIQNPQHLEGGKDEGSDGETLLEDVGGDDLSSDMDNPASDRPTGSDTVEQKL